MIESEFIKELDDIPMVHNTVEYILSTYGVIKDVNPVVKTGLEYTESTAWWLTQTAGSIVKKTPLDKPLRTLDSAAASGVVKVENKTSEVSFPCYVVNPSCS